MASETEPKVKKSVFSVKRKRLEQNLEHITQEMYRKNLELAETNQTLSLLRIIDNLVLESHESLELLCQAISRAVVDNSTYSLVAVLANLPHRDYLNLLGWATSFDVLPKLETNRIRLDDHSPWLVQPERTQTVELKDLDDKEIAKFLGLTHDQVNTFREEMPIKTLVLVKLLARHRLVGLLCIGFRQEASEITEKEMALLDRLSEAIGVALDNKLLYEENQIVLKQLQSSNEKLKTLDETKDEFISMASHQLRTPLTSVKGYISMVVEGDAGDLNKMQKKLLDQAFISSQRMVYLIADLLNVSRLRTGKFIIEPAPTSLGDVVQGEVDQLVESAASRGLELTYDKPKDFPRLMLDETKIRQVVMNFIDNAIYYTPSGGHIKVKLSETNNTIEYTVTDDGIGVPKNEQQHMFSKFYRADNAKKARPDGTGLGLFMTKKVIVAHGGSTIFKSEPGKGSTFGFSFDKAKLAVPDHLIEESDD